MNKILQITICTPVILCLTFQLTELTASNGLHCDNERSLGIRYSQGFLLPHADELYYLNAGMFRSVELSYEWRMNGSHRWHKIYDYPSIGLMAEFTNLGNREKLGNSYAIASYIRMPLFNFGGRSQMNTRLSGGALYLEKPFDPVNNHRNLVIGTHLNVFVQLMLEYTLQINKDWDGAIGVNFNHFSNGSYKKPNKGINYTQASIGLYRVFDQGYRSPEILEDFIAKREWKVMLTGSLKSPSINTNSVFGVGTINGHYNQRFSRKFFLTTGVDLVYNASNRHHLAIRNFEEYARRVNWQVGLFAGIGMRLGKTSLVLTKGYTVVSYQGPTSGIYHRFAFRRQFHPDFFYHIGIFSNYFKANFLDVGIGYTLKAE